ncbi:hypothetical protein SAMN04515650_1247 [Halanaerobium congolense]|nr:hypothetical protein SAMN04515650_1247 [Halanaerobium congolense]
MTKSDREVIEMDIYHIVYNDTNWEFKKSNSKRSIKVMDKKSDLIDFMINFMDGKEGTVKIHKMDGEIEEERTYPRKEDSISSKG